MQQLDAREQLRQELLNKTALTTAIQKLEKEIATPAFDEQRSALERSAKNLNRDGWGRLDGTRQEAEVILQLVSPKDSLQAFDFDANYNWVTNPQLSQYPFCNSRLCQHQQPIIIRHCTFVGRQTR